MILLLSYVPQGIGLFVNVLSVQRFSLVVAEVRWVEDLQDPEV